MTDAMPDAMALVVRLVTRAQGDGSDRSKALQRVCATIAHNLRASLGTDGYDALLARAVARVREEHTLLHTVPSNGGAAAALETLAAAAGQEPAAAAAVEALLVALIETLTRLIGQDMATRIVDPDLPPDSLQQGQSS